MSWRRVMPVIEPRVRALCVRAYPGHPRGCPNHGKRVACPPEALMLGKILNLRKPVYAIWNVFPFGRHVSKMRRMHPDWTECQLRCCLYWQGTARKQLRAEIDCFLSWSARALVVVRCPEACGVNVTETMKQMGIKLQWPPVSVAYQVALAGERRKR